ncbi:M24 family metallopeptidase [Acidisarcina polymorpha]|uniref:M24 family metallopeptidase n=1 Tax=Acidisarcina polymorpha TaxID=2211140 RepID=UPI001374AE5C|nr:M24 family metallopeptidase [Acidisarcina polymorpha]
MLSCLLSLLFLLPCLLSAFAADRGELQNRRYRAAAKVHDGILLVRATSQMDAYEDGLHQAAEFYYLVGLENALGAFLAIDGASGESWLFLASTSVAAGSEVAPGPEAERLLGIDHVVDISALRQFLTERAVTPRNLYYTVPFLSLPDLPENIVGSTNAKAPSWAVVIAKEWPTFHLKDETSGMHEVMAIQSADEVAALRSAGKATVSAMKAGLRVVRPGVSQRTVELAIVDSCWQAGAHGVSYWPIVAAGKNGVVPQVYSSSLRYDHLNTAMQAGDLIHFDVGCESSHYEGNLGRTVPVSGHFTDDQRETWNIFIAAYRAGVSVFREGVTEGQVFDAWSTELLRHRASAKSSLALRAIESWSKRENDPYWLVHYTHLFPAHVKGPLSAESVIDFAPVASIDGQGYYLEDMYRITRNGAELLTPGIPYTAEEIEASMH